MTGFFGCYIVCTVEMVYLKANQHVTCTVYYYSIVLLY